MKVFNNIKEICSYINNADRELVVRNFIVYDAITNKPSAILIRENNNKK